MIEFCEAFKFIMPSISDDKGSIFLNDEDEYNIPDNHLYLNFAYFDKDHKWVSLDIFPEHWEEFSKIYNKNRSENDILEWYTKKFKDKGSNITPVIPYNNDCEDCRKLKRLMPEAHENGSLFTFHSDNDIATFAINLSDTFYYASADAEEIPWDRVDEVMDIFDQFGWYGFVAWTALERGHHPNIPQIRNNEEYEKAYEFLYEKNPKPNESVWKKIKKILLWTL